MVFLQDEVSYFETKLSFSFWKNCDSFAWNKSEALIDGKGVRWAQGFVLTDVIQHELWWIGWHKERLPKAHMI